MLTGEIKIVKKRLLIPYNNRTPVHSRNGLVVKILFGANPGKLFKIMNEM